MTAGRTGDRGPSPGAAAPLAASPEDLAACVGCGLCLPHCPTFRVTGDEAMSPRGRIAAIGSVQAGDLPLGDRFAAVIDTCVGCRGCETACPSGVPYGRLLEAAREGLRAGHRRLPWWQRAGYAALSRPRLLRFGSRVLAAAQRAGLAPGRLGLPRLPLRQEQLVGTGDDVWLFTGCVMDAWQRPVHAAALRVLAAAGVGARPTSAAAPCCGALHLHAGLVADARGLGWRAAAALGDGRPVLVDAAGCGAALKDLGHLIGPAGEELAGRTFDLFEWLAANLERLPEPRRGRLPLRVAIQDPCHLRHVQRAHRGVATVLSRYVAEVVELDDDGLCCGAGGAYAATQPELATAIRERKLAAITRSGAAVVVTANPGCQLHLAAAGVDARHPVEVLDAALVGAGTSGGARPSRSDSHEEGVDGRGVR